MAHCEVCFLSVTRGETLCGPCDRERNTPAPSALDRFGAAFLWLRVAIALCAALAVACYAGTLGLALVVGVTTFAMVLTGVRAARPSY